MGNDQTHRDVGLEPLKLEFAEQAVIAARDEDLHGALAFADLYRCPVAFTGEQEEGGLGEDERTQYMK